MHCSLMATEVNTHTHSPSQQGCTLALTDTHTHIIIITHLESYMHVCILTKIYINMLKW